MEVIKIIECIGKPIRASLRHIQLSFSRDKNKEIWLRMKIGKPKFNHTLPESIGFIISISPED